jgi:predicted dinucleotide-binding enzyme
MNIGIIGSGRIGGTVGTLWAQAGHQVMFSSRHPEQLADLAAAAGNGARVGTIGEAAAFGDVVLLSVPWRGVEDALVAAGSLDGKILIDTTNQFTPNGLEQLPGGISAAEFNARRARGARLVKAYNTLTAGFQAESAGRTGTDRVVMPYAGEDAAAKAIVAQLIDDSGFEPFDVGGWDMVRFIEPPRRPGAFYGEEWHLDTARELLRQLAEQQ